MSRGARTGSVGRARAVRDQVESPFNLILEDFLGAIRFARGAAIVDFDGETVDYAGVVDPFELRVAAATFQLVRNDTDGCRQLGPARQIAVAMARSGYLVRVLDASYSLIVVLRQLGTFHVSERMLVETESRILAEAGLSSQTPPFVRAEVQTVGRGTRIRPHRVRSTRAAARPSEEVPEAPVDATADARADASAEDWVTVEVLGTLVDVAPGERAFRVRLPTGAEVTLLRDRCRMWFSDEPIGALLKSGTSKQALYEPRPAPPPAPSIPRKEPPKAVILKQPPRS